MREIPIYCRTWFAPISVGFWAIVGYIWFLARNKIDPVDELDFWFYLHLYCGIGIFTGLSGWYFARLVARQRASILAITIMVLPAYFFVVSLAFGKNPFVAGVATLSVGFILLMVISAHRSARTKQLAQMLV